MFQRIVVPLDGSARAEQAIPIAARIAQFNGGSLVLLRVVTASLEFAWYSMGAVGTMAQNIDADIAKATRDLTTVAQSADLTGIATSIEVLPGEPALSIFSIAHSSQADLIVMCSHGETGLRRWLLGSVAQKVARHSPIPVLIVHEGAALLPTLRREGGRPLRLLVPLDGSAVAEAALAPAAQLCRALSAPAGGVLHLVRVLPLPPTERETPDTEKDSVRSEISAEARAFAVSEATTYLQRISQQLRAGEGAEETRSGIQVTTAVILHSDIAATVLRIAENGEEPDELAAGIPFEGDDVIAMATHGRGGLGRWLVGSVAERVLEGTRLPLLIVRPQQAEKKQE